MNRRILHRILLVCALHLCAVGAFGYGELNVRSNTHLYMDNSASNWEYPYIYAAVGKENQPANLLPLTPIAHTHLLYYYATTNYTGKDYICLFASNDSWTGSTVYADMEVNGANITHSGESVYDFSANEYYCITPNKHGSLIDRASIHQSWIGHTYTELNRPQTVAIYIEGGSLATWPATISASGYRFNTASSVAEFSTPLTQASPTQSAAYSSPVTLTETTTNDDYEFVGWFTVSGDTLSTSNIYTYDVAGSATIYAHFRRKPEVTISIVGNGTTSFNPSSRITVTPTTVGLRADKTYSICYHFLTTPGGAKTKIIPVDNSNDVIVTGDVLGKYVIQADLKEGADCSTGTILSSAKDSFNIEQYVTLSISGTHTVGGYPTLTATSELAGTFTFTVIDPNGSNPQLLTSGPGKTYSGYQLSMIGKYTFVVTLTSGTITATAKATWEATQNLLLRYNFLTNSEGGRSWSDVPLSYDEMAGCYYYYQSAYQASPTRYRSSYYHSSTPSDNGANVYKEGEPYGPHYKQPIRTNHLSSATLTSCQTYLNKIPLVFVYDQSGDTVFLLEPKTVYRVKSICGNKIYYSNIISSTDLGAEKSLSFFATFDGGLKWQKSTLSGFDWSDADTITDIIVPKDGVYTAKATAFTSSGLASLTEYTGDYKIYGDVSKDTTQIMAQFENISTNEFYNHYWIKWVNFKNKTINTFATVGNDINHCLADRKTDYYLTNDSVNIRFAYNPSTNYFSRTFLAGSQGSTASTFLQLASTSLAAPKAFSDGSSWTYSTTLNASAPEKIAIFAQLGTGLAAKNTYLLSEHGLATDSLEILGTKSENATNLPFTIIYDFKTNRVLAAWTPDPTDTIKSVIKVDADLLVIRNSYNGSQPRVVPIGKNGQATVLRRIIFALVINRDSLYNNDKSAKYGYASHLFQVTLPYEADLTSVYGLPNYGTDWVIQDYKGEIRAQVGWQGEGKDFWGALYWNTGTKLRKGRGYVVSTNYNYDKFEEVTVDGVEKRAKKTLYFPSPYSTEGYILDTLLPAAVKYNELKCPKPGRDPYDSNWRCIGPASFRPAYIKAENLEYFYDWGGSHDYYKLKEAASDRMYPTHNYIIQHSGIVSWTDAPSAPAGSPARRELDVQTNDARYRLDMLQDSTTYDYAYVHLSPNGTDDYVTGGDMLKLFASTKPQVYTVTRNDELAANHVNDTTSRITVGTNLPTDGTYTIVLGNMTAGARIPVLFDAEADTYTNLAESGYTFTATAGRDDYRFSLLFGYQPGQTTNIPGIATARNTTLHACFVDGQIVVSSEQPLDETLRLYDAAGRLLFTYSLSEPATTAHLPIPKAGGIYLLQSGACATRIIIP